MKEMYFTIAGCNHYYGSDFMEKGMKVKGCTCPYESSEKTACINGDASGRLD